MEGQAGRTEYAVTDAACFPVRFTQFTATVRALRAGRSVLSIPSHIFRRWSAASLQPFVAISLGCYFQQQMAFSLQEQFLRLLSNVDQQGAEELF